MKKAILNGYALNGYTVHSNLPIGTPIPWLSDNLPVGFLNCDHTKIKKSDYPELWDRLKDVPMCQSEETDYFFTPDLREITLVGVGENTTLTIAAHDVYELGQFKDDQMQGHSHNFEWNNKDPNNSKGGLMSGGGSYNSVTTGKTELTIKGVTTDNVNGIPRTGTTTHGKQFGVRWIIKATQYATVEQNAIDDTRFTTGNVWSSEKTKAEIDAKQKYSTEEKVIGEWIDGKPIYRKVLDVRTNGLGVTGFSINISDLNIDYLVNSNVLGSGNNNYSGNKWVLSCVTSSGTIDLYIEGATQNLRGKSNEYMQFAILEYTKTTD